MIPEVHRLRYQVYYNMTNKRRVANVVATQCISEAIEDSQLAAAGSPPSAASSFSAAMDLTNNTHGVPNKRSRVS